MHKNIHKSKIKLCRLGGINKHIKQKGNYSTKIPERMYTAPARHGFYAFIYPFIEKDLLSSSSFNNPRLKDRHFNKDPYKIFKASGLIWTHIEPEDEEKIIDRFGYYWVKVTTNTLIESISKLHAQSQYEHSDHVGRISNPHQNCYNSIFEVFCTRETKII